VTIIRIRQNSLLFLLLLEHLTRLVSLYSLNHNIHSYLDLIAALSPSCQRRRRRAVVEHWLYRLVPSFIRVTASPQPINAQIDGRTTQSQKTFAVVASRNQLSVGPKESINKSMTASYFIKFWQTLTSFTLHYCLHYG
jgi:hypothetical protein